MAGVRWAARSAAAVVAMLVLSFSGWTHRSDDAQYIDAAATLPTGPAAQTSADPGATPSPSATPTATVKPTWWSGSSGSKAYTGAFGRWRGEPLTIAGTWDNGNADMVAMKSLCTEYDQWKKPLDVAIGAIDVKAGETWAKAAKGAYDARWKKSLLKMKQCWGSRDASLLYIRFAHEVNIKDLKWKVMGGEEADFAKSLVRFSNLRYQILPKAKVVMCMSDGTSYDQKIDLHKVWPGKDAKGRQVVDVYAVDTYNSWVVIDNIQEWNEKLNADQAGMPLGLEKHRLMAVSWGVPFAVAEWSGNGDPQDEGGGADIPLYYKLMNEWFRAHAGDPKNPQPGQLLYEIQFNYEKRFELLPTTVQPKSAKMYRSLVWGK